MKIGPHILRVFILLHPFPKILATGKTLKIMYSKPQHDWNCFQLNIRRWIE